LTVAVANLHVENLYGIQKEHLGFKMSAGAARFTEPLELLIQNTAREYMLKLEELWQEMGMSVDQVRQRIFARYRKTTYTKCFLCMLRNK